MGSVSRRIKNNVTARKMAINAGLVIPPDTDPMFPEGLGLHRTECRRSMLRLYRQRRAHRKAAKAGRKAGARQGVPAAQARAVVQAHGPRLPAHPPHRQQGGVMDKTRGDARRPHLTAHVLHCLREVTIMAEMEARRQGHPDRTWGVSLSTILRARAFVDDYEAWRAEMGKEVRRGPVEITTSKVRAS